MEDNLLKVINQERVRNNLKPLKSNDKLSKSATNKVSDIVSKGYWQHNSPEGQDPWTHFKNAGYDYEYAGENLARGYNNDSDTMQAWLNSPTHKANILDPNFTEMGVGRMKDNQGHQYIVTHFGQPHIDSPTTQKPPLDITKLFNIGVKDNYSSGKIQPQLPSKGLFGF